MKKLAKKIERICDLAIETTFLAELDELNVDVEFQQTAEVLFAY